MTDTHTHRPDPTTVTLTVHAHGGLIMQGKQNWGFKVCVHDIIIVSIPECRVVPQQTVHLQTPQKHPRCDTGPFLLYTNWRDVPLTDSIVRCKTPPSLSTNRHASCFLTQDTAFCLHKQACLLLFNARHCLLSPQTGMPPAL